MTKEICECKCEHDNNCHKNGYGECKVVDCECKKFIPQNNSPHVNKNTPKTFASEDNNKETLAEKKNEMLYL